MSPRTTTSADDKRERILDAALALFAERGFHGTPVPMVAEQAKVGAGTIYRYFASKEALVNALYQREKQAVLEHVLEGFPLHLSPRAQFHHFFRSVVGYAQDHRDSFRFLEHHHHAAYLDEASRAMEQRVILLANQFLSQTGEQRITKPVAPEVLMAVVWGGIVHLMKDAWAGRLTLSDPLLTQAEDVCWEAVRL
jgi:AcrR family transcriptional regulator